MCNEKMEKSRVLVWLFAVAAVFVLAFGGFSVDAKAADTDEDEDIQAMYRLYNPNSGEHFYTSSTTERDNLESAGWNYEGVAWNAPKSSDTPVYRLYNANAGDHHYTMSTTERDNLISVGWSYEGIGWYSADANENVLYRLYNPNAQSGSHHYTTSTTERDNLISLGWNYEGTAWYGEHNWVANVKYLWGIGFKTYWICDCGTKWYDKTAMNNHIHNSGGTCSDFTEHQEALFENKFHDSSHNSYLYGYMPFYFGEKCTVCGAVKDHYYEYEYELLPVASWEETSNGSKNAIMATETVDSLDECPNGLIVEGLKTKCIVCGEEKVY